MGENRLFSIGFIGVSACLLGYNCRYDGKSKKNNDLIKQLIPPKPASKKIVLLCPERLGGLPVPRDPSDIIGGDGFGVLDGKAKVINIFGVDNTKAFIDGAYAALKKVKKYNVSICFLKANSPS